jgi:hypothetical protein
LKTSIRGVLRFIIIIKKINANLRQELHNFPEMIITLAKAFELIENVGEEIQNIEDAPLAIY